LGERRESETHTKKTQLGRREEGPIRNMTGAGSALFRWTLAPRKTRSTGRRGGQGYNGYHQNQKFWGKNVKKEVSSS